SDLVLRGGGQRAVRVAGQPDGQRAPGAGVGDGADGVRGAAGGGDADHGVVGGQAQRGQVGLGEGGGVLGALDGGDHGVGAARDEADDLAGAGVEGRRALGRVQDAEPPGGAGARVDEPAAAGHAVGDGVDGGGDLRQPPGDGGGDGGVLRVHQPRDV